MTHNDIYTKFMIEYDKANVTSSYPSLTKYEVATILDKAYLTLIARKLTGNNTRRAPFEYDTKAIEDLKPLVVSTLFASPAQDKTALSDNEYIYNFPNDLLYYIEGYVDYAKSSRNPADLIGHKKQVAKLVNHAIANKFKATYTNMPWVPEPVSFIESDGVHVLVDPYKIYQIGYSNAETPRFAITYIKSPNKFVIGTPVQSNQPVQPGSNQPGGSGSGDEPEPVFVPTIRIKTQPSDNPDALFVIPEITTNQQCSVRLLYRMKNSPWGYYKGDSVGKVVTAGWNGEFDPFIVTKATESFTIKMALYNSNGDIIVESNDLTIQAKEEELSTISIRVTNTAQKMSTVECTVEMSGNISGKYLGVIFSSNATEDVETPSWLQMNLDKEYYISERNAATMTISIPRTENDYWIKFVLYNERNLVTGVAQSEIIYIKSTGITPESNIDEVFIIGASRLGYSILGSPQNAPIFNIL